MAKYKCRHLVGAREKEEKKMQVPNPYTCVEDTSSPARIEKILNQIGRTTSTQRSSIQLVKDTLGYREFQVPLSAASASCFASVASLVDKIVYPRVTVVQKDDTCLLIRIQKIEQRQWATWQIVLGIGLVVLFFTLIVT